MTEDIVSSEAVRMDGKELQSRLEHAEEELKDLREKYADVMEGREPVTTNWICQFLEGRHIPYNAGTSHISFSISEDVYVVFTDDLPMVNFVKRYNVPGEDGALVKEACQKVMDNGKMCKAFHTPENGGFYLYMTTMETERRHFESCFDKLISELDFEAEACLACYRLLQDERRAAKYGKAPLLG